MFPQFTVLTWESVGCFGARTGICLSAATIMYFCFERNMSVLKKWLAAALLAPEIRPKLVVPGPLTVATDSQCTQAR